MLDFGDHAAAYFVTDPVKPAVASSAKVTSRSGTSAVSRAACAVAHVAHFPSGFGSLAAFATLPPAGTPSAISPARTRRARRTLARQAPRVSASWAARTALAISDYLTVGYKVD